MTYPPGAFSDTDELVAVCDAIKDLGGFYVTHARYSLGDRLLDPFREAVAMVAAAGCRYTFLTTTARWTAWAD